MNSKSTITMLVSRFSKCYPLYVLFAYYYKSAVLSQGRNSGRGLPGGGRFALCPVVGWAELGRQALGVPGPGAEPQLCSGWEEGNSKALPPGPRLCRTSDAI